MRKSSDIVFFDTEVKNDNKIADIGAIKDGIAFHSADIKSFVEFTKNTPFLCGHNIVNFDYKFIKPFFELQNIRHTLIDTLYWSPLLFPQNPYHNLVKDDKLYTDDLNNPYNDSLKAKDLFYDEVNAFLELPEYMKKILYTLLRQEKEFCGLFEYLEYNTIADVEKLIKTEFNGKICANSNLSEIVSTNPVELAYTLSLINSQDKHSITPPWVINRYPKVEIIIKKLCNTKCNDGCEYCHKHLDIKKQLKIFGHDDYKIYDGENLQEQAVQAAVNNESLLAVFPTGGGKSIAFQVPALMAGENERGLTVVISPLQSLMKDQVDKLREKGIAEAVTINGSLNPIEKAEAIRNVENGNAYLLYISPELLRSKTIENLLKKRNVVRFVIDEAHCFSAWGQDFRVDYLYIAKFIQKYKNSKQIKRDIPVSCFTATAKQKVISDICEYFENNLEIDFKRFLSTAGRKNLHYKVKLVQTERDKYAILINLIKEKNCPTIVYVSTVKKTKDVAEKLYNEYAILALPYNGKMERNERIDNQNKFMNNTVNVIVATSAFGMGVDKKNVGLVVHFEISNSIENYIQEAGRAGRDGRDADCYLLFNEDDLNKHFQLLNQNKLNFKEIKDLWKIINEFTKDRPLITKSTIELARGAGWNTEENDIDMKVKNAVQALENSGYLERRNNVPHVYATDISIDNVQEGNLIIDQSTIFQDNEKDVAKNILRHLIGKKWRSKAGNEEAEARVDYIADILGIKKYVAIDLINKMREHKILNDAEDMSAQMKQNDNISSTLKLLKKFYNIEKYLVKNYEELNSFSYKSMNDKATKDKISSTIKDIKSILMYWILSGIVGKKNSEDDELIIFELKKPDQDIKKNLDFRYDLAGFIIEYLYNKNDIDNDSIKKNFSILELKDAYNNRPSLFTNQIKAETTDIKDTLNYLSKLNILDLSGGFLVFYNDLQIEKLVKDNKIRYKKEDYALLNEHYQQKIQQIHIVGEYAHLMVENYERAQDFVFDYFNLDYQLFQRKYFKGNRKEEIKRNITPNRYNKLFGDLSQIQRNIIDDDLSRYIVVTAGPGSGKTKILVHKLASLQREVKKDKLLMLTFARSAATEFKERLVSLIGTLAHYVEIKTFHSYCFDLIGKIGSLDGIDNVVTTATNMIRSGEVEKGRITKSVLVIDEAQDISKEEYELIKSLIEANPDMKIIAVGDDDQSIFGYREKSKNKENVSFNFLSEFIKDYAFCVDDNNKPIFKKYEMIENYRSYQSIINAANKLIGKVKNRIKKNDVKTISNQLGKVIITKYETPNLQEPTLNLIKNTYNNGTCCILTPTNKEALNFVSLLIDNGYPAKLIQSNEGFDLCNLFELNLLTKKIQQSCKTLFISNDIWNTCVSKFKEYLKGSSILEECKTLLEAFDKNYRTKYIYDFQMYLKESKLDDFISKNDNVIYVSTLHKSKGREFDNIYMMLNNFQLNNDDDRRVLYVGMTRAKKSLYINYNNDIFDDFNDKSIEFKQDANNYPEYQKVILELGHDDVYLGYFDYDYRNQPNQNKLKELEQIENKTDETIKDITKYKNYIKKINILKEKIYEKIRNIKSGEKLIWNDGYLDIEKGDKAISLSQEARKEINNFIAQGYIVVDAKVRFKVHWQNKERTQKGLIILPTLYLGKRNSNTKGDSSQYTFQKLDIVESEHFGKGTIISIEKEIAEVLFDCGEKKIHIDYITKK